MRLERRTQLRHVIALLAPQRHILIQTNQKRFITKATAAADAAADTTINSADPA